MTCNIFIFLPLSYFFFQIKIIQDVEILSVSVSCITSLSDPIIYAAVNPQFRTEFHRLKNKVESAFSKKWQYFHFCLPLRDQIQYSQHNRLLNWLTFVIFFVQILANLNPKCFFLGYRRSLILHILLDFTQADSSAITERCREEAPHAVRSNLGRHNPLSRGMLLSCVSNNQWGLPVGLRGPCSQDPPLGQSGPHMSSSSTSLLSLLCYKWSSLSHQGGTLWNPS